MPTALGSFCQKHRISVRQLSDLCGGPAAGLGKSSAHRLIQGTADSGYVARVLPRVVLSLAAYLASNGIPAKEIESDIHAAFPNIKEPQIERGHSATCIIRNGDGRIIHVYEITL
jgi:hypothetical protein